MNFGHVLSRPAFVIGVLASIVALVCLVGLWFFEAPQLTGIFKGGLVIAYFSFLAQGYIDRKPIKVRDGSSVSLTENPILYRSIYAFFAMFGAAWAAVLFSAERYVAADQRCGGSTRSPRQRRYCSAS